MDDRSNAHVEFGILGPVEASRDGATLGLGGPRQQHLLALLLLTPGRSLSQDQLIDEIWASQPPEGAEITLRSYVSRLRRVVGDGVPIRGTSAGYAIDVAPAHVDARRFEGLVRDGEQAFHDGAAGVAARALREALSEWRGEPFAGLPQSGALQVEAERLKEIRLRGMEVHLEAELALGGSAELIDELESLVSRHPYRERLWQALMLALYRAGRQADALGAYHRARRALDDELGIEPSEELRRLEQQILRQDVPPAMRAEQRHNLPAQLSSFVGRESEIADLLRLLRLDRLVTLTGIGGVGKTRLALEVAERSVPDLVDGVFFVDLSGLAEPALLQRHVASALDVRERAGSTALGELVEHVRKVELLLVLDNCEHLRDACAELVDGLLRQAPRMRVLATSRLALGVPGEVEYDVAPFPLPVPTASSDELRANAAVSLLVARARAARPRLTEDEATLRSAARICRDLDGLPLALELAAARAKALSLEEIATRLDDRFRFLVSWRRLTPARHQTLQQAMDWSYELLSSHDRDVLGRLSVFAGGFTLDAVAVVCTAGDADAALVTMERLVAASLVGTDERRGATRYGLLETVRQYAATRLERATADAARAAHADYYTTLTEKAELELNGPRQTQWFETLEEENDNLRATLAYLDATAEHERLLRAASALTRFWYVRGYLVEARLWLERALAAGEHVPAQLRRRGLTAAAAVSLLQGDYDDAVAFAESSLDVARASGEPRLVANGLSNLGAVVLATGDHRRAGRLLEEAVELARDVADGRILALALNNLADYALTVGDYAKAGPLFVESLALLRARDDTANVARSLFNLACVALMQGETGEARNLLEESLANSSRAGDKEDLAWGLLGLAALTADTGETERAAVLLGASTSLLDAMGAVFKPFERQLYERAEAAARESLGGAMFESARSRGTALDTSAVLEFAMETFATA